MKIQHLFCAIVLSSFASVAIAAPTLQSWECLKSGTQHNFVLVAPTQDSQIIQLMYYPYLKPVRLHHVKTEYVEMAEGRPFEQHLFFNELNGKQLTGQYEVILQGARIYGVTYTAKTSGRITAYQVYLSDVEKQKLNQILMPKNIECI
ncbi:hypothetical protein [Acinetobacter sp.]|uniref:hypothetical protein n=1 Tax=Acinetobacter sp. TaxID=472 RepID=UPI0035AF1B0F